MDALLAVRGRIARTIIGAMPAAGDQLGAITLRPHQRDAVRRLDDALQSMGGALLADAPGLGKTFVALAMAHRYARTIVVAPAALKEQWQRAAAQAAVRIGWCSVETLSRRAIASDAELLVIDEAHHLRNHNTLRYRHVAALAAGKRVLLLSATPVHNRAGDQAALFALFLGARAFSLPPPVAARLVVRREAAVDAMPQQHATRWLAVAACEEIGALLRSLPAPLPAADGREAAALVQLTLAHAWSSSVAALDATLCRALQRARAIDDCLSAGRWPTRRELSAWLAGGEWSQLAFPLLVASETTGNIVATRAQLAQHVAALTALRRVTMAEQPVDVAARAELLRTLLRTHHGATIVAFARYAATVDALYLALRLDPGVVALTARGVRSAGGGLRRGDILRALAATAPCDARTPLRLVLATDLLGEGLDLRAASVIVHLDQPWTPALIDQREGRATRLSSPHAEVFVYAMRPPREAARRLALPRRLRTKRSTMSDGAASGRAREQMLDIVRPWLSQAECGAREATATASIAGTLAVVHDASGEPRVLGVNARGDVVEDDDALLPLLRAAASAHDAAPAPAQLRQARRIIRRWLREDTSAQLTGATNFDAARAALTRRLDAAVCAAPLHRRITLHQRVAQARDSMTQVRGAWAERALGAAARCVSVDEMLVAIASIIAHPPTKARPKIRAHIDTLLVLIARR